MLENKLNSVNAEHGEVVDTNINLQLFADDGANEGEPANPQVQDTGASVTEPVTSEPAEQKPVQDPQTNAYFAEMRRKAETAEAKAAKLERDMEIARQYGHYGIYTEEDYQKALAEQEAQQMGVDPTFYQEFNNVKSELMSLKQEKEAISLANDPVHGSFYKQWEGEIRTLAQQAGVPIRTAYTVTLERKLPEILNSSKTQGQQDAITKLTQNAQTSPGALGGEPAHETKSIAKMSAKDMEELALRVKRGERITL